MLATDLQNSEQEKIAACKEKESPIRLNATLHPFGGNEQRWLGENLLCQNRYMEAIAVFRKLMPLDPKYLKYNYSLLGSALFEEQGASSDTIEAFHSSLDHDLNNKELSFEAKRSLVHQILARKYKLRGDFDKAESEYRRSLKLDPTAFMSYQGLSQVLLAQNKKDSAIEAYTQFLQANPAYKQKSQAQQNALKQNILGDHYRASGKIALAIQAYRQATQLDPEFVNAYGGLGAMLAQNNQLSEAQTAFENEYLARDSYDETIGNDTERRTAYNRRVESIGYQQLGFALSDQNNWQEAIKAFRRATELGYDQQSEMPVAFARALIHLNQSDEAFYTLFKHYDTSSLHSQESRQSKESIAYESLSRIYIGKGDIDSAVKALQKSASPPYYLGWWLRMDNKTEQAIQLYEDYLNNNSPQESLLVEIGRNYGRVNRWEDALAAFQKATQLKSSSVEDPALSQATSQEQQAQAYIYLGDTMKAEGLTEKAIEAYKQAVQLSPQSQKANYLYVELHAKNLWAKGNIEDAMKVYRQFLELNPKESKFHNNLGLLLLQKQRYQEAAISFQRSIDLAPGFQEAKNNLKHVQEKIEI